MAVSFTFKDQENFPVGTTVEFHSFVGAFSEDGPPPSTALTSGVMTVNGIALSGLEGARPHFAYALVNGKHTYTFFFTPAEFSDEVASLAANAKGVCVHDTNENAARPTQGYASIEWIGSVEPLNANNGDTWVDTSVAP